MACRGEGTSAGGTIYSTDSIRLILCKALDALLRRDESFASALLRDRRLVERMVKVTADGPLHPLSTQDSRIERSASLHCLVLALRLARVDNFSAEVLLPVMTSGALSGVVEYPSTKDSCASVTAVATGAAAVASNNEEFDGSSWPSTKVFSAQTLTSHAQVYPLVEAIEDGAQALLEILETVTEDSTHTRIVSPNDKPSRPLAPGGEIAGKEKTTGIQAAGTKERGLLRFDCDDPATCGTFALRRLCVCGLGFALLPPALVGKKTRQQQGISTQGGSSSPPKERFGSKHDTIEGGCAGNAERESGFARGGHCSRPSTIAAIVETLVVAAHGRFLHPDAAAVHDFLTYDKYKAQANDEASHQLKDDTSIDARANLFANEQEEGEEAGPLDKAASASTQKSEHYDAGAGEDECSSSTRSCHYTNPFRHALKRDIQGGHRRSHDDEVLIGHERKGNGHGICMMCAGRGPSEDFACAQGASLCFIARLLLAQIPVLELEKARARAVSHAKRWRLKCEGDRFVWGKAGTDEGKRVRAEDRRSGSCGGGRISFGPAQCRSCRLVVLGHPLDTIAARCGLASNLSGPSRGVTLMSAGAAAGAAAPAAAAAAAARSSGQTVGNGGVGCHAVGKGSCVGVAAVTQALGWSAVATVAEDLDRIIKRRHHAQNLEVAKLAEAQARVKEAKQVKLDRSVDFRRRLAAAAREAREEIESSALRRRLLPPRRECSNENVRGGKGFHDDGDLTQEEIRSDCSVNHGDDDDEVDREDGTGDLHDTLTNSTPNRNRTNAEGKGCQDERRRRSSALYRDLARGMDDAHSAILKSMHDDGLDTRAYIHARRKNFRDDQNLRSLSFLSTISQGDGNDGGEVAHEGAGRSRGSSSVSCEATASNDLNSTPDGNSEIISTEEGNKAGGGGDKASSRRKHPAISQYDPSRGGWRRDDNSSTATGAGSDLGGKSAGNDIRTDNMESEKERPVVVHRDAEQLRLARAQRAAKEEALRIEKREAIETERGARRRAKDRAEAVRADRKAKALAREEVARHNIALEQQEEDRRVETKEQRIVLASAAAFEKKRQGKIRRVKQREERRQAATIKERHEQEMSKIEQWRDQERQEETRRLRDTEDSRRAEEAARIARADAISQEEEQRRSEVEAKRLALLRERQAASRRLTRGEFRYLRGKLVYNETKGGLLSTTATTAKT